MDICGKPLIAWSIEAAKKSKYINQITVSSDSDEVLKIASSYGIEKILRPNNISDDFSTTVDVISHTIKYYKKENFKYIILLQPTSPLRDYHDIDKSIELLRDKNADAVISVCESPHSPLWMNALPENLSMNHFIKDSAKNKRSQDLDSYYMLNGAIYLFDIDRFKIDKTLFFKKNIYAYIMDKDKSIDIDTQMDFEIASLFLKKKGTK